VEEIIRKTRIRLSKPFGEGIEFRANTKWENKRLLWRKVEAKRIRVWRADWENQFTQLEPWTKRERLSYLKRKDQ